MKKKILKKIIIILSIILIPFCLPIMFFIYDALYDVVLIDKITDTEKIGNHTFNIQRKKFCQKDCYKLCLDKRCKNIIINDVNFLDKMYVHDGILYVLTLKHYYSIKNKWNIQHNKYINDFKLLNTEKIDGNIIEKYEVVIEDKKYNINIVYR